MSSIDVTSSFTGHVKDFIGETARDTGTSAETLIANARKAAPEILKKFQGGMESAGKAVARPFEKLGNAAVSFTTEQGRRVAGAEQAVQSRVTSEISGMIIRAGDLVAPVLNRIQVERAKIRGKDDLMFSKLGLLVEGVSDVATPVVDRILDEGRDIRDASLGITREGIRGAQAFGRSVSHLSHEATSPVWNGLTERWEDLRVRSNDARGRINGFLNTRLGSTGARFRTLAESAAGRARRIDLHMPGMKLDGGKIYHNGVEVPLEKAKDFIARGAVAGEFLKQQGEKALGALEQMRRYAVLSGADKWAKDGLSALDIRRNVKIMRAMQTGLHKPGELVKNTGEFAKDKGGRALNTLGTGAAVATAGVMEAVTDPRLRYGMLALVGGVVATKGALELHALLTTPGALDNVVSMLSHIGTSGVEQAVPPMDMSGGLSGGEHGIIPQVDASGPSLPLTGDPGLHAVSTPPDIMGHNPFDPNVHLAQDVSSTQPPNIDITQHTGNIPTGGETVGINIQMPEGIPADIWHQIKIGQPIAEQAHELAKQMSGNPDENYARILKGVFEAHRDNFSSTVEAIIRGEGGPYTDAQIAIANKAKSAIDALTQNSASATLELLGDAMHFWRPM